MIRIEGLRLTAGAFKLSIDSLTVDSGEFLVILGPTGSGKTMLLETVAGLRTPEAGRVWIGEREVTSEPPEKRRVGFVYQDYALFPHLTVAENIAFGLRCLSTDCRGSSLQDPSGAGPIAVRPRGSWATQRRRERSRVRDLASALGIEGLLDRYPTGLSGGEQQRVALARALAIEPDVLLFDEPFSALDRQTRQELRAEVRNVCERLGATVMHVTHDLDEGLELGDTMAVIVEGALRQVGKPVDVMRCPVDVHVARLTGCVNVFAAIPEETAEGSTRVRLTDGGRAVELLSGTEISPVLGEGGGGLLTGFVRAGDDDGAPGGDGFCAIIRPDEIALGIGDSVGFNARVQPASTLDGTIRAVRSHSAHASVEVEVPPVLTVHVLNPDLERLELRVGDHVRLTIPASAVHLCRGG